MESKSEGWMMTGLRKKERVVPIKPAEKWNIRYRNRQSESSSEMIRWDTTKDYTVRGSAMHSPKNHLATITA
jgi:hypothetical protein